MEKLNGPVYRSWDEAMSDPSLDLSKPWYVVPDPEPAGPPQEPADWSGWVTLGATEEGNRWSESR